MITENWPSMKEAPVDELLHFSLTVLSIHIMYELVMKYV